MGRIDSPNNNTNNNSFYKNSNNNNMLSSPNANKQQQQQQQQQQNSNTSTSPTYYQEWFQVDKRRREISFYLNMAIENLKGRFPYQRQRGLDQLIHLLHNQLLRSNNNNNNTNTSNSSMMMMTRGDNSLSRRGGVNHNLTTATTAAMVSSSSSPSFLLPPSSLSSNSSSSSALSIDQETFNLIHKSIHEETNVVLAICKYILRKQQQQQPQPQKHETTNKHNDGDDDDDDEDETTIHIEKDDSLPSCLNTKESRIIEIKKALTVLEGCFLLSPECSSTLATINGFKVILNILSEGIMYINDAKYLHFKHSNKSIISNSTTGSSGTSIVVQGKQLQQQQQQQSARSLEQHVEEIQLMVLDTLEAALHNCPSNTILFCSDSGPDIIVTMFRHASSHNVKVKCVEFIVLLLKWAQITDEQAGIYSMDQPQQQDVTNHQRRQEDGTTYALVNRIKVFLGAKITEDLTELLQKVSNNTNSSSNTTNSIAKRDEGGILDTAIYDQFVKRMDQRLS